MPAQRLGEEPLTRATTPASLAARASIDGAPR